MSWLSAIPIIGGIVDTWQRGRQAVEQNKADREQQTLTQFAQEFVPATNWFDSLINGLNRLPRPLMVVWILYYFWLSWGDPGQFARINTGLSTVPEKMWEFLLIVVGFYFGLREFSHWREASKFKAVTQAAASVAISKQSAAEWLRSTHPDVQLKDGVVIDGLDIDKMGPAIAAARNLYHARGEPCVITSALDGKHSKGSLHYKGLALDFRTRTLDDPQALATALATALGDDYDVVLEGDHLHVEYDPETFLGGLVG